MTINREKSWTFSLGFFFFLLNLVKTTEYGVMYVIIVRRNPFVFLVAFAAFTYSY